METVLTIVLAVLGIFALIVAVAAIGAWFTFMAWNAVMPYAFHLPIIDMWQAFALNILAGTLIKSHHTNTK